MNWCEYFYYDETSPSCLRWKEDRCSGKSYHVKHVLSGDTAGSVNGEGYWQVKVGNKNYQAHRVVYEIFNGEIPKDCEVDHLDQNVTNNKIQNLRVVPKSINLHNKGMYSSNKTGINGVSYRERLISGNLYKVFSATWKNLEKKQKSKDFSVNKHGYDRAFQLACEYRAKMIEQLNEQGAGYSPTHGQ